MLETSRRLVKWLAVFLVVMVPIVDSQTCQLPPRWTINGEAPMERTRGNVTVVSLLQASWPTCLWQASGFENIRRQLLRQNVNDIQFIIVNSQLQHAMDNVGELSRRVSFPVYQDTRRSNIWTQLNGGKDDTLIYDRCGYLTYHIPYPLSLLNRRDFQLALWDTYFQNPCDCEPGQATAIQSGSESVQTGQGQSFPDHHQHHQQHHGHHNQHHHHGHRAGRLPRHIAHHSRPNRRNPELQDIHEDPQITLHTNRWAEILSNRISKCRFEDTLCHILYSNGIRYRRRHARFVDRMLQNLCEQTSDVRRQCMCPTYAETASCNCTDATVTFGRHNQLDMLYCACSQNNHPDACVCKSCSNFVESTTCPPGERQTWQWQTSDDSQSSWQWPSTSSWQWQISDDQLSWQWPISVPWQQVVDGHSNLQWLTSESWQWQVSDNGQTHWQWPSATTWGWQISGNGLTNWQWPSSVSWQWQMTESKQNIWQWPTSGSWRWQSVDIGSSSWNCQTSSPCDWQVSDDGETSWQWPMTGSWQWRVTENRQSDWQWQAVHSWQWHHTADGLWTWQWHLQ